LFEALAPAPVASEPGPTAQAEPTQPTPEQNAVNADLHWLIHQGHVIEFANGTLETAKKPAPKPPKPEPKPADSETKSAEAEIKTAETAEQSLPDQSVSKPTEPGASTDTGELARGEPVQETEKPDAEQGGFTAVPSSEGTIQEFNRAGDESSPSETKVEHQTGESSNIPAPVAQPE